MSHDYEFVQEDVVDELPNHVSDHCQEDGQKIAAV